MSAEENIWYLRREEVTEGWIKLRNEGLHNLYSLPNIIRVAKSGRMEWSRHVARVKGDECMQNVSFESRREETTLET
jgi:hypothetical protein